MRHKFVYNPTLSVKENAVNNGVSISAVRKYIKANGIDRRGDETVLRVRAVENLKKRNPQITIKEIASTLGWSWNTAKKYFALQGSSNIDTSKVSAFDISKRKFIIKSVSSSQTEILSNILRLYIKEGRFDCDLTASIGVFYRNIPVPYLLFDKYPQMEGVRPLQEAFDMPSKSLKSIVLDLPFIIKDERSETTSLVAQRFNCFRSEGELYETNEQMLALSYRLLKTNGCLIVKTMDLKYGDKQIWVCNFIQNKARELGFKQKDLFILTSNIRHLSTMGSVQRAARKYHCYFLVFQKR